jgi:hypothetical protein
MLNTALILSDCLIYLITVTKIVLKVQNLQVNGIMYL